MNAAQLGQILSDNEAPTCSGLYKLVSCPRLRQLNLGRCTGLEEHNLLALLLLPHLQSLGLHQCTRLGDGAVSILCQHPTLSVILAPSRLTWTGIEVGG